MEIDRRRFLAGAAAAVGTAWLPLGRVFPASAADGPPGFPPEVAVYRQRYQSWSKEMVIDDLWTCQPATPDEVVRVVRWARAAGWRVRPRGAMHGWSPLLVTPGTTGDDPVLLVDTSGLVRVELTEGGVRAGAGATLLDVLVRLEGAGMGLASVPAVGDVTLGGMLAIGAHGAAVPATGEMPPPSASMGSLSAAVRELTVVAWDPSRRDYALRTFRRGDRELPALACALGRTLIVEAVLDAIPLQHLRCQSYIDIPGSELFAPPGAPGRTFASFLDATGRAEALWYPFTENPWLKVWSVAPQRPLTSRPTSGPYNYPFSDRIPDDLADLASELVTSRPEATPTFGQMTYAVTAVGLAASASFDLWGPAKDTQLYIQASTLRVRGLGLAVLTSRADVQPVTHLLARWWTEMIEAYANRGEYPVNMPLEVRASAVEGGAGAPILTATSADPTAPAMDTVLYVNPLTLTGTPGSDSFFAAYEQLVRGALDPAVARLRPEWSKTFAYTDAGPSTDGDALADIRHRFRAGRPRPVSWDGAATTLKRLDPDGIFGNDFLDGLFER